VSTWLSYELLPAYLKTAQSHTTGNYL